MALSRSVRSPVAAARRGARALAASRRPLRSRRAPPANAGALAALENIGRELRRRVDAGHGVGVDDAVLMLAALRSAYRAVRALRPGR